MLQYERYICTITEEMKRRREFYQNTKTDVIGKQFFLIHHTCKFKDEIQTVYR